MDNKHQKITQTSYFPIINKIVKIKITTTYFQINKIFNLNILLKSILYIAIMIYNFIFFCIFLKIFYYNKINNELKQNAS